MSEKIICRKCKKQLDIELDSICNVSQAECCMIGDNFNCDDCVNADLDVITITCNCGYARFTSDGTIITDDDGVLDNFINFRSTHNKKTRVQNKKYNVKILSDFFIECGNCL